MKLNDLLLKLHNDIYCGHHSGFPLCCNLTYSILDHLSYTGDQNFYYYRRLINKIIEGLREKEFNYIPCFYCVLFSEPVEIKDCDCISSTKPHLFGKFTKEFHQPKKSKLFCWIPKMEKIADILLEKDIIQPTPIKNIPTQNKFKTANRKKKIKPTNNKKLQ